ncbi:MAG: L-histidine N(alpha)-methyltransferase [Acidimicrobiia bacterium]
MDLGLVASDLEASFRADVEAGLLRSPKEIPSKWFYDEPGSKLFDAITRLPEYYPTRRERAILEARAETIAEMTLASTVVELGSGTSEKTRILLDALRKAGTLRRFVPFDVSEETLAAAAEALASEYRGVEIHAVVADLERHLDLVPTGDRRLVVFLGSTIGNLSPARRHGFLAALAGQLRQGDALLLGTDLLKDVDRLERAYDDDAGVTAAFNLNLLERLNRELGANFSLDAFEHVARFVPEGGWVEMALRSLTDQVVRVAQLGITVAFASGEEMRTEISTKFHRDGVESELAAAGLALEHWWTDPDGDFALSLSVPR